MKIFVDADACPVVGIVEKIAGKYSISVTLLCDTNHILHSEYSEVITVSAGADAVDIALMNICKRGDIVVTQDYGVAAMALGKGAYCIHQSGKYMIMIILNQCSTKDIWQRKQEWLLPKIILRVRKSVQMRMINDSRLHLKNLL